MNTQSERRVLLVDDDIQMSQIICAAFRMGGVRPVMVEVYRDALAQLALAPFELVLLDLALPDSPPRDTILGIRDMLARGAGRIVVITGTPLNDAIRRSILDAGAEQALAKDEPGFVSNITSLLVQEPQGNYLTGKSSSSQ